MPAKTLETSFSYVSLCILKLTIYSKNVLFLFMTKYANDYTSSHEDFFWTLR